MIWAFCRGLMLADDAPMDTFIDIFFCWIVAVRQIAVMNCDRRENFSCAAATESGPRVKRAGEPFHRRG
jgi:hypothetical protein